MTHSGLAGGYTPSGVTSWQ